MATVRARGTRATPQSLSVEIVDVTPAIAEKWLTTNDNNRNLKRGKIAVYARQMKAGEWALTGQSIQFDTNGKMIDGQHRLHAVIESGKTVPMLVAKGIQAKAQAVIDTGAARTFGDVLTMRGIDNPHAVAAIAKRLVKYEEGIYSEGGGKGERRFNPANFEMADVIKKHPGIHMAAAQCARLARGVLTPSVVGLWHVVLTEIDPYMAEEFFIGLRDGANLTHGSPILALRNRLDRDRIMGLRVSEIEQAALVVYAWNAFREGRDLTKLQLPKGGVTSANFPTPVRNTIEKVAS